MRTRKSDYDSPAVRFFIFCNFVGYSFHTSTIIYNCQIDQTHARMFNMTDTQLTPPESNQEVFDRAWHYHVTEGNPLGKNETGTCSYQRGCFVGCQIPEEMRVEGDNARRTGIKSLIEGIDIFGTETPSLETFVKWFDKVDITFLKQAQSAHDVSNDAQDVKDKYTNLANQFNLTIPA